MEAASPIRDYQKRQACPACKYHRRKCTLDCYFANYYPADLYEHYPLAQKRYGLRNLEKLTQSIHPHLREIALRTLVFESQARATYSVAGCLAIINDLSRQIQQVQSELNLLLHQLAKHRPLDYQPQLHQSDQFQSQEINIPSENLADSARNYVQYLWEPLPTRRTSSQEEQAGNDDDISNLFSSMPYVEELKAREGDGNKALSSSPYVEQYVEYPRAFRNFKSFEIATKIFSRDTRFNVNHTTS